MRGGQTLRFSAPGFTDQNRWWLTTRETGLVLQHNLTLSSTPRERTTPTCAPRRPTSSPTKSSSPRGANVFLGAHDDSFFGQFEDNTHVCARVRCGF